MEKLFAYTIIEKNNQKIYEITWISKPIPLRVYTKINHLVTRSNDYSPVDSKKKSMVLTILEKINSVYKTNITVKQYISIRSVVIKQKIIKNYHILNHKISKITKEYNDKIDIMDLSVKYDFPPVNLLKNIFLQNGLDAIKIRQIFKNKYDPKLFLSERDLIQYNCAEKNDANSVSNQIITAKFAMNNELLVVNFFKKIGIICMTQDELASEQIKEYGKVIITPDILFIDPVYINNVRVHWIDYKNYVGTDIKFIFASNFEQATRYNKKYGPGALCYHNSFVDNIMIPNTMMLDADALDIEYY